MSVGKARRDQVAAPAESRRDADCSASRQVCNFPGPAITPGLLDARRRPALRPHWISFVGRTRLIRSSFFGRRSSTAVGRSGIRTTRAAARVDGADANFLWASVCGHRRSRPQRGLAAPRRPRAGRGVSTSSTQDIVVDAWRIEAAADADELGLLSASYQFGYRLAVLVSEAAILILANQFRLAALVRRHGSVDGGRRQREPRRDGAASREEGVRGKGRRPLVGPPAALSTRSFGRSPSFFRV